MAGSQRGPTSISARNASVRAPGRRYTALPSPAPRPCTSRADSELRPERVVAFRRKFSQLAAAEEALYREQSEDTRSQKPQLFRDFIVPSEDEYVAMMAEAKAAEAAAGAQLQ